MSASPARSVVGLALVLSLGPAVAIGFARFAYALLLPSMRIDLGWTFARSGSLNTANALGYLLGALSAAWTMRRYGLLRTFGVSMLGVALALLLTGVSESFGVLLVARALAGVAGAWIFISGGAVAARVGADERATATAIGTYYAGAGLGIAASGVAVPVVLGWGGHAAWPWAWIALGGLGVAATLWVWGVRRGVVLPDDAPAPAGTAAGERASLRPILATMVAYLLFAAGYIAYMTFLLAWTAEHGLDPVRGALVWIALGLAATFSSVLWRAPLASWRGARAMAGSLGVVALGALLPVLVPTLPVVVVSALLFGSSFMTVVASVTNVVRRAMPVRHWNAGIAASTVVFGVGQSVGPLGSGLFSDRFGLNASLVWTAALVGLGVVFALLQRVERARDATP